jgi:transposase
MRQAQGLAPGQRRSDQPLPVVTEAPRRLPTPRRATGLVIRPPERPTAQDRHQLAQLTEQSPELAEAVTLAQGFAGLVRQRQPTRLEPWLARAATSALPPFRRFARGLRADLAAVQAAVTLQWSQGPIGRVDSSTGPIIAHPAYPLVGVQPTVSRTRQRGDGLHAR